MPLWGFEHEITVASHRKERYLKMKFNRTIAFLLLVTLLCMIVPQFPAEMVHKVDAAGAVQGIESGQSYYLRVKKSNKCLDLQGSGITNGTHFQQYKQGVN